MAADFSKFGVQSQPGSEEFWREIQGHSPLFTAGPAGWQALFLHRGEAPTVLRFDDRAEPVPMRYQPGPDRQAGDDGFSFAIVPVPAPFRVSYGFEAAAAPAGLADPLNPQGAGPLRSIAATPDAAEQRFWPSVSADALLPMPPIRLRWNSDALGNRRTVRMQYIGPELEAAKAVVLLLDGDDWIHLHPAATAFEAAHQAGELPPCTLVFIPSLPGAGRRNEFALNPLFWAALEEELLPLLEAQLGRPATAGSLVLAGQSYGGLAALFATISRPEIFPLALCQSGSFWYPAPADGDPLAGPAGGTLAELITASETDLSGVTVAFDVGIHEGRMLEHQAEVVRLLEARGATVRSNFSAAGHDRSSWRDALLRDTAWILGRNSP